MSYHGPEEMPVSKVHVHFLLELIKVALRQNPGRSRWPTFRMIELDMRTLWHKQLTFKINFISAICQRLKKFTIEIWSMQADAAQLAGWLMHEDIRNVIASFRCCPMERKASLWNLCMHHMGLIQLFFSNGWTGMDSFTTHPMSQFCFSLFV